MRVRSGPEGYNNQPFIGWISSLLYDPLLYGLVRIPDFISQPTSLPLLINTIYSSMILQAAIYD
jgi:hypothetical protein